LVRSPSELLSACCPPSTSTINFRFMQAKSATYRPIGLPLELDSIQTVRAQPIPQTPLGVGNIGT